MCLVRVAVFCSFQVGKRGETVATLVREVYNKGIELVEGERIVNETRKKLKAAIHRDAHVSVYQ